MEIELIVQMKIKEMTRLIRNTDDNRELTAKLQKLYNWHNQVHLAKRLKEQKFDLQFSALKYAKKPNT